MFVVDLIAGSGSSRHADCSGLRKMFQNRTRTVSGRERYQFAVGLAGDFFLISVGSKVSVLARYNDTSNTPDPAT